MGTAVFWEMSPARGGCGRAEQPGPGYVQMPSGHLKPTGHGFPQSGSWGNGPSWRFRHLAEAQRLRGEGSLFSNSASHSFSTTCTKGVLLSGFLGEPGALSSSRSLKSPLQVSSQEIPEPGKEVRNPQRSPGESFSGSYRVSSIFSAGVLGGVRTALAILRKLGRGDRATSERARVTAIPLIGKHSRASYLREAGQD